MKKAHLYRSSPISYYRFGSGPDVLVAFHGYNQSGHDFLYFEDVLGERFTVIAIDFFWHGDSEWREAGDFTETDMREIVKEIAERENLHNKKFTVCSFSMGARMARALVRTFPMHIDQLILLSPPTFAFNRFLNFTTGTFFGLCIFRYFVKNHHALMWWVELLYKLRFLDRSVYIFTSKFIGKPERLERVYKTWYSQRKLLTDFKKFSKLVSDHGIHVTLIVGKNDTITPPHKMIRYVRKLPKRKVYLIPKKHELATPETKLVLAKIFRLETGW